MESKIAVKATFPLVQQDTARMVCNLHLGPGLQHLGSGESSYIIAHACCGCQVQSYVCPRVRTLHVPQLL